MRRNFALIAGAVGLLALAGCGASLAPAQSSSGGSQPTSNSQPAATAQPTDVPTPTPKPAPTPVPPTDGQQQAMDSAASYLSEGTGWSRNGLITQLDSAAGEGFSKADATYAVDAQGADWNAQAVLSAASYLSEGTGFSRNGLIEQLDSSAGAGFTKAQATHGVDAQGADWNAQAVLSAQTYLNDGMGFSRNGLIQQLVSGEGFTKAQATYGVTKAMV